jgi:hypothetical protein
MAKRVGHCAMGRVEILVGKWAGTDLDRPIGVHHRAVGALNRLPSCHYDIARHRKKYVLRSSC